MKRITTIAIAVIVIAAAGAQAGRQGQGMACAPGQGMQQDRGMGMRQGPCRRGGGIHQLLAMADEIGLSEDQVARLETMSTEFRKSMIDDRAALEKARVDLQAIRTDDSKTNAVLKLMDDIGRMETEMSKAQYLHRQQISSVLTEDQRTKLRELRQERRADGQGRGLRGDFPGMRQGRGMGNGPGDCDGTGFGYMDFDGK